MIGNNTQDELYAVLCSIRLDIRKICNRLGIDPTMTATELYFQSEQNRLKEAKEKEKEDDTN